ncbi:ubiquitin thioesterase zranb1-B [Aplysia californica]|uniref:ubiquitinyl hydrolase 1 n=1 Tax=Aplysia californica TaxID=6500 RepID=A0ABM0K8D9_APLCA|nr:ubiquitin thioesterase zranb1-B [Aplysia californica]XP_005111228.1 ubiquitin thioesterase zranb1-B [Aplysia californica]
MNDGSENNKWSCEFCTYENFPAAKKCTMCFKWRSPHLISDTINEEQDIYKMAPLVSEAHPSGGGSSGGTAEGGKWACEFCTYLNWAKTVKCVQCLNSKRKPSPPTYRAQEKLQNICVTTSDSQLIECSSPKLSPNSYTNKSLALKETNSDNKSNAYSAIHNPLKWICVTCTYENWPRSQKCVICLTPRGRPSESPSPVSSCRSHEVIATPQRRSPTSSLLPRSLGDSNNLQAGASASSLALTSSSSSTSPSHPSTPPMMREKRLLMLRSKLRDSDWLWLNACMGTVDGDLEAIHAFIAGGGHPSRQLTMQEVELLNRPSAFQVGYTLVHLAIRFQREDMLAILLAATEASSKASKRLPCMACPDVATDIRRQIVSSMRQRKGDFPCSFFTDCVTFSLPVDIEDLARHIQEHLFDEILDRDVQNELEVEESIINWSLELTDRLGSRLYALWNRTAGDCLLDSVLQAAWGVFDLDNSLRRALAESLRDGAMTFYPRWKEYESMQAESLQFSLDESQWQHDWAVLLSLASQPGTSLEQTHIFALAHILRRPIIVYGVKYVKSFKGETIGFAKFQGVYIPLLWEPSFCWKTPLALGYTRGHFSALVPMELDMDDGIGAGANTESPDEEQVAYLPLVDCEGKLLQVHFLSGSEIGREEMVLREWLHCHTTEGGLLVATQRLGKRPLAVKQMVDEWLDHYRRLQAQPQALSIKTTLSSDGESDDE